MDNIAFRDLSKQLADDFAWLEEHCRRRPEQGMEAGQLRLAASLVRNVIGPFLDNQPVKPLHVVVVGGAGAGKSTVANMLSGDVAAEANPQAGFTRHPIAYTSTNGPLSWAGHVGFLGPLQRMQQPGPSSLDDDVYQVRRVPAEAHTSALLQDYVVWDCPDMTTWAAGNYVHRLLEVAGLADILIYVASDERYNDELPTQFLQLLLWTGKPVVACLMKMQEPDAPAMVAHFQQEVLRKLSPKVVSCQFVPFLTPDERTDPVRKAPRYRIPLLNQVAVLGGNADAARRRSVQGAARFLQAGCERLIAAARQDVAALDQWQKVVQSGQVEFDNRYRREFLASEKLYRFDEAMVRLMDLLELPGVGKVVSTTLWVLRTPYRLLKGAVVKAVSRPEYASLPERSVLEEAFAGWLDLLRKEAVRRGPTHPLWEHVEKGFGTGLADAARERFEQGLRAFQLAQGDEVDRTARAIYEELEKNPAKLNTLRGVKLTFDLGAIGGTIASGGIGWHDLILVPVVASITHQLVELLGKQYVENQREMARQRQAALMAQYVSNPAAEWLTKWPATGGSEFERLQLALRRIPPAVHELEAAVKKQLAASK
ncbi:MAG TPA: GTPase [Gemmataceae bacterium]|nr:GTPase [Gemmataceae bacterium]